MRLGQKVYMVRKSLTGVRAYEFTVTKIESPTKSIIVRKICPIRKECLLVPNELLSGTKNGAYERRNEVLAKSFSIKKI